MERGLGTVYLRGKTWWIQYYLNGYLTNVRTSLTRKCQDIADLKAGLCQDIADPIQASLNLVISFDRSLKGGL